MSKELLKRAADKLRNLYAPPNLVREIDEYLEMPEPEPVAWMVENHPEELDTFVNFTPNFNSHFEKLGCKVTPLYTTPPGQSTQIAALKHELQQADEDYVAVEEAYLQCQKDLYDETEKLAALQAKREPLSDDEIQDIHNELPSRSTYYEFARAIEAAHGIGEKHE